MKRLLGPCLLVCLVLAGCGDSTSGTASDPGDQPSTPASEPGTPDEPLEPQTVAILSQTAAGGRVDLNAVPVDDEASRQAFTAQFRRTGMDRKIAAAVASAKAPEGYTLMAAVVSIGCDVPPGVTVTQDPDGWVFKPQEVAEPLPECFAPVTSVAVVAVPA